MNGSPATSSIAFGTCLGQRAQPRRKAAGEQRKGRHVGHRSHDGLRSFEVEAEADFLQARSRHGVAQPRLVLGIEHQEAAAARADQLAARPRRSSSRDRTTR